jgi:hypothetical protein
MVESAKNCEVRERPQSSMPLVRGAPNRSRVSGIVEAVFADLVPAIPRSSRGSGPFR